MADAWFGEPFVSGDMIGEMRTCNGTTVTGGAVLHSHDCPMHGPLPPLVPTWQARKEELARAERSGYERAIAALRDGDRFVQWAFRTKLETGIISDVCAQYLESLASTPTEEAGG